MNSRKYQEKIDELILMQPNYIQLEKLWFKTKFEVKKREIEIIYKDAQLTTEQIDILTTIFVKKYKESLTDELFEKQLNEIHKTSIDMVITELVKLRDSARMTEMINGIDVWND